MLPLKFIITHSKLKSTQCLHPNNSNFVGPNLSYSQTLFQKIFFFLAPRLPFFLRPLSFRASKEGSWEKREDGKKMEDGKKREVGKLGSWYWSADLF
jgi:hypothetical protein